MDQHKLLLLLLIQHQTVNQPTNQVVCNNTSTTAINFSVTGATSYTWTNSNTSIGLAASGTGNIARSQQQILVQLLLLQPLL
jgi:hypothetical protein